VREAYREVLGRAAGRTGTPLAERLYSAEELQGVPAAAREAALGLGNPVAAVALRLGETALDLGCGAGIDALIAARQVGPTGRVIGLDLTPEMVGLARKNAGEAGLDNVEIVEGGMEDLGFQPSASVDAVVCNGVLNLCGDKERALAEIHRVLRPGGRVAMADLVVNGEVPQEVLANPAAWSG
jgi:ubiquinone/menaquinone biosynthesis C-methylase UbiE